MYVTHPEAENYKRNPFFLAARPYFYSSSCSLRCRSLCLSFRLTRAPKYPFGLSPTRKRLSGNTTQDRDSPDHWTI